MQKTLFAALAAAWLVPAAFAEVKVDNAWVRATVPSQKVSGAYLRLTSDTPARLIGARSSRAGSVEIHAMKMHGDVMQMTPVSALELPAGKPVALQPGGYHLMIMDLKGAAKAGDNFPLTLIIESADGKRSEQEIKAKVQPLGYTPDGGAGGGHAH
ncbi:MAG: copper chaperone PCu(A)C [Rhodocyclaceae bacterium]|nr:copper chaperone PCu(A)C [Rhodocyclaceae bacterium]MBX3668345.1 copper chaperone PCu(A)C [Rhodocyclaceae bacterium]